MVEAGGWGPGRQSFAAEVGETLLEAYEVGCALRIACGNRAAGAGVAALEIYFADAEADDAALVLAVELVFPERGQISVYASGSRCGLRAQGVCGDVCAVDFKRGAKA